MSQERLSRRGRLSESSVPSSFSLSEKPDLTGAPPPSSAQPPKTKIVLSCTTAPGAVRLSGKSAFVWGTTYFHSFVATSKISTDSRTLPFSSNPPMAMMWPSPKATTRNRRFRLEEACLKDTEQPARIQLIASFANSFQRWRCHDLNAQQVSG